MAGYYEDNSSMNEGLANGPSGGSYPYANWSGGSGQNWGGLADTEGPHGGTGSGGFVIPGVATNHDPIGVGGASDAVASHYYQGFWAGVQGALYGSQPQTNPFLTFGFIPEVGPFGPHSYGFATNVLQALAQPPTHDLTARVTAAARTFGNVSHPFDLWLTPSDSASASWAFGNGPDDWPSDLPDWGDRAPGSLPSMPGFSPIKGRARDLSSFVPSHAPTEQEIQDAGNPALWLLPREVDPIPALSSPGAWPNDMTPIFPPVPTTSYTLIPFDITPGNTISDVTPRGDWTD